MNFFKYRKVIVLGILIFLSLLILTLKSTSGIPSKAVISLFAPLQEALTSGCDWLGGVRKNLSVDREGESLQEEIHLLKAKITELEEERLENQRLRRLLAFKERESFESLLVGSVGAKVIGREPTGWYRVVTIDKGSSEGIREGMPVVTAEGIVGYVREAAGNASRVQLILDNGAAIGGLVQRSRENGVVKGNGTDLCDMVYLSPEADIKEGDLIISSGLGGRYPPGLRIGKVVSVERESYLKKAKVLPTVDFSRLEEVLVLKR